MAKNESYLKGQTARRKAKKLHLRRVDKTTTSSKRIQVQKVGINRFFWERITHFDRLKVIDEKLQFKAALTLGETINLQKEQSSRKERIQFLNMFIDGVDPDIFRRIAESVNPPNVQLEAA